MVDALQGDPLLLSQGISIMVNRHRQVDGRSPEQRGGKLVAPHDM